MDGNQQKIREALVEISKIADDWSLYANTKAGALDRIYELANAALSEPPRNCDVGTAEEQLKRQYDTVCNTTNACPDSDWSCRECFAHWEQMPYETVEGGGDR